MRTLTAEYTSFRHAIAATELLVRNSRWFTVVPLPDDMWEVTVKDEAGARRLLQQIDERAVVR